VKYFINNSLYIENSENRGRGVFTSSELPEGLIIEHSPVLESYITKWRSDPTESTCDIPVAPYELKKYIFSYPWKSGRYVIAWGYISLYNHADDNNAMWYVDETKPNNGIYIKTLKKIMPGEEVFVSYGSAYWSGGWKKY